MKPMKKDIISGNQRVTTCFALEYVQLEEAKKRARNF